MTLASAAWRWLVLAVALVALNAAVTFHNVWPTLGVRLAEPRPEVSLELAAVLVALVAAAAWRARRRGDAATSGAVAAARRAVRGMRVASALAVAWLLLALARYAEVTAPALYGRPVNLYWDLRHVGHVLAMLAEAGGVAWTALAVLVAALALAGGVLALRFAWRRVLQALAAPAGRAAVGVVAGGVLGAWLAGAAGVHVPREVLPFAQPVTATYAQQLRLVAGSFAARDAAGDADAAAGMDGAAATVARTVPAADGPAVDPGAPAPAAPTALAGDDVLLVFVESYGAVAYTRADFAARLAPDRARLAAAIAGTGRRVASATVVAPTFGGNSWLSHLTLLAGREVRDPDAYARTMQRPAQHTLVQHFANAGYRTVALMPGLRQAWPEGAWYGFDAIHGAAALDWRGPEFGWWRIPDQYALARLDALEPRTRPRFVVFPTISSHVPFRPLPPYQPDWARLLGPAPFGPEAAAALAAVPEWTNLGPAYGDGVAYAYAWLAGWLRERADAPQTLVVIGDHQPPAAVGGPSDDWRVPVHVITRREAVLDSLRAAGFVDGLEPAASVGRMGELNPLLRAAFGGAVPGAAERNPAAMVRRTVRPGAG